MTKNTFMFPLTGEAEYNFGHGGILLPDYPTLELRILVNDGMVSLHNSNAELVVPITEETSSINHLLEGGETCALQYLPVEYYINDFVLVVSCLPSPGMRLIDDAVYRKCSGKCRNSEKCHHKMLNRFLMGSQIWQYRANRQESTKKSGPLLFPLSKSDELVQTVKDQNRETFMSGIICYRCSNSRWPVPVDRFYLIKNKSSSVDQQQEQWKVCCPFCLVFMNKRNLDIRKLNLEWVLKFNNHCLGSMVDMKANYLELTATDGVKNLTDGIESVCSLIGRFIVAIVASRKHIYENSYAKAQKLQEPCSSQSEALETEREQFLRDFVVELSNHQRKIDLARKSVMELSEHRAFYQNP